ncbi:MAG: spore coat associated protein CotJA [Clostridium sp.]|jgi:hypothetical protein|nr:spore coat associated protein CotJA [Clostridium sp.]
MQERAATQQLERYPVGMAYVPWQHFRRIYDNLDEAYKVGTIFPELNLPFTGKRGSQ